MDLEKDVSEVEERIEEAVKKCRTAYIAEGQADGQSDEMQFELAVVIACLGSAALHAVVALEGPPVPPTDDQCERIRRYENALRGAIINQMIAEDRRGERKASTTCTVARSRWLH